MDAVRAIERQAVKAKKPDVDAYDGKVERAKAERKKWEQDVKKAVDDGNPPPEMPPEANMPEEVVVPRAVISDTTPEALGLLMQRHEEGLLLHRDELAGWLNSFNRYSSGKGGERELWLQAYDGRAHTIDRAKNPVPIHIPHLSVGILGSIQPDKLAEVMDGPDDGLTSRFLWCWPDPVKGFKLERGGIDNGEQIAALQRIFRLQMLPAPNGGHYPGKVELTGTAADEFEKFVGMMKERALESFGPIGGVLGKTPGHALRLALVLTLLSWAANEPDEPDPAVIDAITMKSAIRLVQDYTVPMAMRAFGEAALSKEDGAAITLAKWLRKNREPVFNGREARRQIGGIFRKEDGAQLMGTACELLADACLIRERSKRAGSNPGRKSKDFEVNPAIWR